MTEASKTSSKLPPNVLAVLLRIQAACPQAVIAGGYLRDYLSNVQPKDIDVFVPPMSPTQYVSLRGDFWGMAKESFSEAMDYVSGGTVSSCHRLTEVAGIPVQLIELVGHEAWEGRYKTHDFGQCQCMDDGDYFEGTALFVDDHVNSRFTLDVCEDQRQFDRSMRRWTRLQERYPNHTLSIPEKFKAYTA